MSYSVLIGRCSKLPFLKDDCSELSLPYIYHPSILSLSVNKFMHNMVQMFTISQPDEAMRTIQRGQQVIHRVAGNLIQEKKRKIVEGETKGSAYEGKDLLSRLCEYS